MADADPAITPVSLEEMAETVGREWPHAMKALIEMYVKLVPVHEPELKPVGMWEQALWLSGGMHALMLIATAGQAGLAHETLRRLVAAERERRRA